MKKNFLLTFVALLLIGFSACNKKNDKKDQTTAEKIIGIWHLDTDIYNEFYDNKNHYDTTKGGPNDILEFKKDGSVAVTDTDGSIQSSTYSLVGDTKIIIGGNIAYDIKTLTANLLVLYTKADYGSNEYDEETLTLKR